MSNRIESLTPEQEAKMDEYVRIWTEKGLTTERRTQEEAERDFTTFQRVVLERENPFPVVLFDSPKKCWEAVLRFSYKDDPAGLEDALKNSKIVYPYFDCQFWAGWFAFYEFFRVELGIKFDVEEKYLAMLACQKYGMVWPLEGLCVVCQPPTIIKRNERGLHCENGPALSYNGDNEIYSLNGVTVPKELVMTPAEDLDVSFFTNEQNADVKAEFVRKFGVERMIHMGKLVDSYENYPNQNAHSWWWKSQYELYDMAVLFEGLDYQPYIKMLNQTTGIWHMEAVSPACRNLEQALKERFGGRDMKIVAIA